MSGEKFILSAQQNLYQISENLRALRLKYGYTQSYVAQQIGIRYQSYHAYETGITVPTLANFIKLAKFYDVPLDELIR